MIISKETTNLHTTNSQTLNTTNSNSLHIITSKSQYTTRARKGLIAGIAIFISFILWTIAVMNIDLQSIGPNDSLVGFATMNGAFHNLTGVNFTLYTITDWLGIVPFAVAFVFAMMGLVQLIKRRSLFKVDIDIIVLGFYFLTVIAAFFFFEYYVVNRRPVLINGYLEASYPSSTTMVVLAVMFSTISQIKDRMKNGTFKKILIAAIVLFVAFMAIGRLISGVHWLSDIIGGCMLSTGLFLIYWGVKTKLANKQKLGCKTKLANK